MCGPFSSHPDVCWFISRCAGVDRRGIEEDVEVIRVQRETRQKSDRLLVLESQYSAMERVRVIDTFPLSSHSPFSKTSKNEHS